MSDASQGPLDERKTLVAGQDSGGGTVSRNPYFQILKGAENHCVEFRSSTNTATARATTGTKRATTFSVVIAALDQTRQRRFA